jgi:hypothetical protein
MDADGKRRPPQASSDSASGRVTLGLAMNIDCAGQPGHAGEIALVTKSLFE